MSQQVVAIQLGSRFLPPLRCRSDRTIGVPQRKRFVTMASFFPYPDNTSALLCAVELVLAVGGPNLMYREMTGNNLKYSKFATDAAKSAAKIPSKTAILLVYSPAALLASAFLANHLKLLPLVDSFTVSDDRVLLVAAALSIHFLKRVLETLFVHKYSGSIPVKDTVSISSSYTAQTGFLLYAQQLSAGMEVPFPNLKWVGVAMFAIGIAGNGYHHWVLANLRKDGTSKYTVPRGGLFDVFVCPHYIFEIIDFVGIALVSQTLFGVCLAWFVLCYLTGRTFSTKQWYLKKVDGFPKDRSVLIPNIF